MSNLTSHSSGYFKAWFVSYIQLKKYMALMWLLLHTYQLSWLYFENIHVFASRLLVTWATGHSEYLDRGQELGTWETSAVFTSSRGELESFLERLPEILVAKEALKFPLVWIWAQLVKAVLYCSCHSFLEGPSMRNKRRSIFAIW